MSIQDRINKIGPFFKKMGVTDKFIYIVLNFPDRWGISESAMENFKITSTRLENGEYYFYADRQIGFDNMFDAIEYTINFNRQAEEKIELLKAKINELQKIFSEEDISVLKTIEFKYKKKNSKKNNKVNLTNSNSDDNNVLDTNKEIPQDNSIDITDYPDSSHDVNTNLSEVTVNDENEK